MKQPQSKVTHKLHSQQSSSESSSLKFLTSDKDDEQLQQPELQAKKRNRQWSQQNSLDKQNIKRKDKPIEDQANVQSTFLYKPAVVLPNLFSFTNQTIKVIIAAEYINKTNPSFISRKIYGTDTYTAHSDCVCIGVHFGFFGITGFNTKKYQGVEIVFKVVKPKKNYNGSNKNGITSQTIKNYNGSALKPQSYKMLTSIGTQESLQRYASNMRVCIGKGRLREKPQNINKIIAIPQANIVFNMNNQPAMKYSIFNIADKGFEKSEFLIRKLDTRVIYFETADKQKYELSKYIEKTYFEAYRFAKVKNPIKFDNQYFSNNAAPLAVSDLQILESLVEWDEIIMGASSIKIKDRKVENLVSFKFHSMQQK